MGAALLRSQCRAATMPAASLSGIEQAGERRSTNIWASGDRHAGPADRRAGSHRDVACQRGRARRPNVTTECRSTTVTMVTAAALRPVHTSAHEPGNSSTQLSPRSSATTSRRTRRRPSRHVHHPGPRPHSDRGALPAWRCADNICIREEVPACSQSAPTCKGSAHAHPFP